MIDLLLLLLLLQRHTRTQIHIYTPKIYIEPQSPYIKKNVYKLISNGKIRYRKRLEVFMNNI